MRHIALFRDPGSVVVVGTLTLGYLPNKKLAIYLHTTLDGRILTNSIGISRYKLAPETIILHSAFQEHRLTELWL